MVEHHHVGEPRRFALERISDLSGVSGTGTVATGVQWPDGVCAMRWMDGHRSTVIYDSSDDLVAIHGHGGLTRIVFLDDVAWAGSQLTEVPWGNRPLVGGT